MRIAIMAAGAVGGYFGARLAAAGHEVLFFARGAHLDAIRKDGLRIESPIGDLHLPHVHAAVGAGGMAPVDIVLFAVKLWDTEVAAQEIRPLVGPSTRVITLQNGIDSVERLQPALGDHAVVGGVTYIGTTIGHPGMIKHTSQFARIICGRTDGRPDQQLTSFVESARDAGVDAEETPAIDLERWKKFIFLVGMSGATAALRSPIGPILADPDTRALFTSLMQEVVAIAHARGVPIEDQFIDQRLAFLAKGSPGQKASMLHDLERNGRLELDWLAGKVVALGREHGVPTPTNEAVYAVLKLHREGRRES